LGGVMAVPANAGRQRATLLSGGLLQGGIAQEYEGNGRQDCRWAIVDI
jgi:hypothetical protein